jgi:hypothetical protein
MEIAKVLVFVLFVLGVPGLLLIASFSSERGWGWFLLMLVYVAVELYLGAGGVKL